MTYVLAVLWLLVFAFSALPVYFFYNMDATCHTIDVLTETPASINQLCVDARQYGNQKSIHGNLVCNSTPVAFSGRISLLIVNNSNERTKPNNDLIFPSGIGVAKPNKAYFCPDPLKKGASKPLLFFTASCCCKNAPTHQMCNNL